MFNLVAAQTSSATFLEGTITDDTGETLMGASVQVRRGVSVVGRAITAKDGHYRLKLDPGKYDLEVTYSGLIPARTTGVEVRSKKINSCDFVLASIEAPLTVEFFIHEVPLIKLKVYGCELNVRQSGNYIPFLPNRQIKAVAYNSIFNPVNEPRINFRGARESGEMVYYGNYNCRFASIPVQEIEQPLIDPGGLPADFGNLEEYEMSKNHFRNLVRGGSEKGTNSKPFRR
jgi:hypothetical protein